MKMKKSMKTTSLTLLLVFISNIFVHGQELILHKSIPTANQPVQVSKDRQQNFYIADTKGNIRKYNADGELQQTFSPTKPGRITSLDAWESMRIFAFYKDWQEYLYLDRFMNPSQNKKIGSHEIGFASLITLANDNNLWVIDESDLSLKKYNPNNKSIIIHTPFNLLDISHNLDLSLIREYQNQVFIHDKNSGILVFDNLGNYIRRIPSNKAAYFNFHENDLYFIDNNKLIFRDIYTHQTRELQLPQSKPYTHCIRVKNNYIFLSQQHIDIYQLQD
jgi:hypothetical protein